MSVNMPAKNTPSAKVSLGTTHDSKFKQSAASTPASKKGVSNGVANKSNKANLPANNTTNNMPALGNTKHGVGQVPGYLKHKG